MSQEEKAKAYDEAIERAKKELDTCGSQDCDAARQIFRLFPELKESEDERIRKEIIAYLDVQEVLAQGKDGDFKEWIAWLEKQGQKKSDSRYDIIEELIKADDIYQMSMNDAMVEEAKSKAIASISKLSISELLGLEKQGEQNPIDKVEPKFKVGDWVVQDNIGVFKIIEICKSWYEVIDIKDNHYSISFDNEHMCHLWTIQDAKDGDVLYSPCCKLLWIYKNEKTCHIGSNLNYNSGSIVINKPVCIPTDAQPATKEQRNLLFQKMKEAGYEYVGQADLLIKLYNDLLKL